MNDEQSILWILDTLGEGGYSFSELIQYTRRNKFSDEDLERILLFIYKNEMISIRILEECDTWKDISSESQLGSILDFVKMAEHELQNRAMHYFFLLENGRKYLKNHGIIAD